MHTKDEIRSNFQGRFAEVDPVQTQTIFISKTLTVKEQIAEVIRVLGVWLRGLEAPLDPEKEGLFLTEYREKGKSLLCRYEIFEKYPNRYERSDS